MDTDKLVEMITLEVMRRLGQPAAAPKTPERVPRVLVLFTGGTIGLEQGLEEVKKLQAFPASVSVVLSSAAEKIVGAERIRSQLGSQTAVITAQDPYPGKMLREADVVLVPVLTQNTAAKVALTLADSLVSTVMMQALMMGKTVVAAYNAADPRDGWREKANMGKAAPGLVRALQENLKKLEGFGIELVHVEQLAHACKPLLCKNHKAEVAARSERPSGKKEILDAAAIRLAASQGLKSLAVTPGTIVTPLARDVARECEVELIL